MLFRGLLILAATGLIAGPTQAEEIGEIDWQSYAMHAGSLAFVASGLSMVDHCDVPLVFREIAENGTRILDIVCREEENGSMAKIYFYESDSDAYPTFLTPWKIIMIP